MLEEERNSYLKKILDVNENLLKAGFLSFFF